MPSEVARDTAIQLPEGVLWRRSETQIVTRLGVFPGDTVVLLGPPERDLAPTLAKRLPRVGFLQVGGQDRRPFGWSERAPEANVERLDADVYRPPVDQESVDAVVVLFALPLLTPADHRRLVDVWAPRLQVFGKWISLVALDGPKDPRLQLAERDLKDAGFEKVRSMRLALGRMGQAIFLQTARWPGIEHEDGEGEGEKEEE